MTFNLQGDNINDSFKKYPNVVRNWCHFKQKIGYFEKSI